MKVEVEKVKKIKPKDTNNTMRKKEISITRWLNWRYPEVFKDFKKFAARHELFSNDNIHGQNDNELSQIINDYFVRYNLSRKSSGLDKATRKGFAHINILLR
jgi:hypothetical protein